MGIGVAVVAQRMKIVRAEKAPAAGDGKGDDNAVAGPEVLDGGADLDDLPHELVAEDVSMLHSRDEAVVQVQVGAANGGRRDANDGVARVDDVGFRDVVYLDPPLALPANCLHDTLLVRVFNSRSELNTYSRVTHGPRAGPRPRGFRPPRQAA